MRGCNADSITVFLERNHIAALHLSGVVAEDYGAFNHVSEGVELLRYRLNDFSSRLEREIQIENRRACLNDGVSAQRFTGNNTHPDLSVGRRRGRNFFCRYFL